MDSHQLVYAGQASIPPTIRGKASHRLCGGRHNAHGHTKAKSTKTGWAVFPADLETRTRLLAPESRAKVTRAVGGTSVALLEMWHNYAVLHVATPYKSLNGEVINTTPEMVAEHVTTRTEK